MNFERIGGAQIGNQKISVRPTVLIGLGGTGKEVLRRLRRLLYEKHRLVGLPIMEYLWFDTDVQNIDIARKELDLLDRKVDFSVPEMVDGRVMPENMDAYRTQKGAYPHIWNWLPDALDVLPTDIIMQGASQIRPCGRLAFFHHFTQIRDAIERKVRRVTSAETHAEMTRLFSDYQVDRSALEIVLVTSIAGGTGSGSFIDFGFLCREMFPNSVRTAYLVLPSVFDSVVGSGRQVTYANGYAALKELEYFTQPRLVAEGENGETYQTHTFTWDGQEHRVPAPPFSTIYQIDDRNLKNVRMSDFTDTFQMIAEFLLLEFEPTNFATDKRSVRSNLEQHLHHVVTFLSRRYVQYFPCHYASFGLSQIELNQPRLANAAANKFAQYLIEFILAKDNHVPPGYSTADVRPHLEQMDLTVDRLTQLALRCQGTDESFSDRLIHRDIITTFNELKEQIRKAPAAQDQRILEQQVDEARTRVEAAVYKVRTAIFDDDHLREEGTRQGEDLKEIIGNVARLRLELEKKVEDHCIGLLCDPLKYGPNFMIEFLNIAREAVQKVGEELNRIAANPVENPRISPINVHLSDAVALFQQRLREAQDLYLAWQTKRIATRYYRGRWQEAFRRDAQIITGDLVRQVETVQVELTEWVERRYRAEAARRLAPLVKHILDFLGSRVRIKGDDGQERLEVSGLQARIQAFQDNLQEMADQFNAVHQAYMARRTGERNLNLMPELNYGTEVYQYLSVFKQRPEADPQGLCKGELTRYFLSPVAQGLFAHLATFRGADIDVIREGTRVVFNRSANRRNSSAAWDEVQATIDLYTFDLFRGFKNDIQAVANFKEYCTTKRLTERDEIVKRSEMAAPRVSSSPIRLPQLPDYTDNRIGLSGDQQQFLEGVNRVAPPAKGGPYQFTRHTNDAVIFVNQWVAFPLCVIGNVVDMKEMYEANRRAAPINVYERHLTSDFIKYQDILPPRSDEEAQDLVKAQQPMIDGLIMGIIQYDRRRGFHQVYTVRGVEDVDYYGDTLQHARLQIGINRDIRERLKIRIEEIEGRWRVDDKRWAFEQRLCLLVHLLNRVFPRTQLRRGQIQEANSIFRGVLEEAYESAFSQTRIDLGMSDDKELDARLSELKGDMRNFAEQLPYRDEYCKDFIYVLKKEIVHG